VLNLGLDRGLLPLPPGPGPAEGAVLPAGPVQFLTVAVDGCPLNDCLRSSAWPWSDRVLDDGLAHLINESRQAVLRDQLPISLTQALEHQAPAESYPTIGHGV
jgi:hypothetical protein